MRRREFITLIGGAAAAWPLSAHAQQGERVRRLGVLMNLPESDANGRGRITALREELMKFGWVEDRNFAIDIRWTTGNAIDVQAAASKMVGLGPDVIVATATNTLQALRPVARDTPIVFVAVSDPVAQGFIDSLAHPGGHITGFTSFEFSMAGKWLEILKEISPRIRRAALIFNPDTAPFGENYLRSLQSVAETMSIEPLAKRVRSPADIETGIRDIADAHDGGLIVIPDTFTLVHRQLIISGSAAAGVPTIYCFRFFATGGGLISYGIDNIDLYRRAASYIDRILKGANPAELPVQQPTKFELVINLNTAKTLGLTVPPTLLAIADEVIE